MTMRLADITKDEGWGMFGRWFWAAYALIYDTVRVIQNSIAKIASGPLNCVDTGRAMPTGAF